MFVRGSYTTVSQLGLYIQVMKIFRNSKAYLALKCLASSLCFRNLFYTSSIEAFELVGAPKRLGKQERKPFLVEINELKRKAKLVKRLRRDVCEIPLKAPENGLLVKNLIPVAHEVYAAGIELFGCVSRIIKDVPVHMCRSASSKLLIVMLVVKLR